METDIYQSTSLRDYFKVIFKHKMVFITTVIVLLLTIYIKLSFRTPIYQATVTLMKAGEQTDETAYYSDYRMVGRELIDLVLVKSSPAIETTVNALKLYNIPFDYEKKFASKIKRFFLDYQFKKSKQEFERMLPEQKKMMLYRQALQRLKNSIQVNQVRDLNVFAISVTHFNSDAAVLIVNVLSRAYLIYDLERQLEEIKLKYGKKHSIVRQVQDKISELRLFLDGRQLSDLEAIGPASIKIIEQAKRARPIKLYNESLLMGLTLLLSAVLGVIFSFGLEYLDQSIKSPRDVETFLGIPFLGSLPEIKSKQKLLLEDVNSKNDYSQFYRRLTNQLYLLIQDKKLKTIVFANAESSEDTTTVIANIGMCLANNLKHRPNNKVLIIDANLRNPSISRVFNINDNPGLADLLEDKFLFEDTVQDVGSNLVVLTAGQTALNPSTLLGSSKMLELINTVKEKYEMVFLACSNLKHYGDAAVLSSATDAVVLVIDDGKVRYQVMNQAIAPFKKNNVNLLGAILNNRKLSLPRVIYDRI